MVAPLDAHVANDFVRRHHYSGKTTANSQLHLGVYLGDRLGGVMQFGPSLDKRRMLGLVKGTKWNGFLELNRLAFSDLLPRNSESRALAVAFRMIRKHYPHIEWVVSFADGTQCGDGTIYRASGFVLTGIKKNTTIWSAPSGETFTDLGLRTASGQKRKAAEIINRTTVTKGKHIINRTTATDTRRPERGKLLTGLGVKETGAATMQPFREAGFAPLPGYQLRYVYFLNPEARDRLSVPIMPFSKIADMDAGMYKGEKVSRGKEQAAGHPPVLGGATPTPALQTKRPGRSRPRPVLKKRKRSA